MASFILSYEREIERHFKYGLGVDELFLQTFAMKSPLCDKVTGCCMHYIDWERGRPYTFLMEDYDLLVASDKLFARKFNYDKSPEIIEKIVEKLLEGQDKK